MSIQALVVWVREGEVADARKSKDREIVAPVSPVGEPQQIASTLDHRMRCGSIHSWCVRPDGDARSGHVSEPPNGSRLSCGRNARQRKEVEPMIVPAGEATQFCPLVSARQLQALVRHPLTRLHSRWPTCQQTPARSITLTSRPQGWSV